MIIAPLSRLLQEVKEKEFRPQLELAQRNAMKLTAMIHQLIDFERVENNVNSTLMLGRVDFVALAHKVFCGFEEGMFRDKEIIARFETNVKSCYQQVDELKMESAMANLLSNAGKYTPQGGCVTMKLMVTDDNLCVVVQDTGIGIPAKDLPYVSQRFFQSSATKGKKEGTGIGLYMVRAYTELHGGTFEITSEEGQGTCVTLTLPMQEMSVPSLEGSEGKEPSEVDNTLPAVLIVDDNQEVRKFVTGILRPYFICFSADHGKDGLEKCVTCHPALIITDMMMPIMDGMEMCQQLRQLVP